MSHKLLQGQPFHTSSFSYSFPVPPFFLSILLKKTLPTVHFIRFLCMNVLVIVIFTEIVPNEKLLIISLFLTLFNAHSNAQFFFAFVVTLKKQKPAQEKKKANTFFHFFTFRHFHQNGTYHVTFIICFFSYKI